jgi:SNF2 family DNA or RNA helicase
MELELTTIVNTPVLCAPGMSPHWGRVYGATLDKKGQRWLFPAFPPFLEKVLHDVDKVYKDVQLSTKADAWCNAAGTLDLWKEKVRALSLPIKSYAHQLDGLAELLYHYRWVLQWEMGTGKTKVVVDAVNILKCKTLVLCPLIALDNWKQEIALHSGNELSTLLIDGASRKKKLAQIADAPNYDIIVCSFDTARIYGTPRLYPAAIKLFQRNMRFPHPALKKILIGVNSEKIQKSYSQKWLFGQKPKQIREEINALIGGQPQWLFDLPYDTIVADESHRIKRIQSARTKICLQLSQKATRRYLLTGTMAQGDPRDLYPQLNFLAPYLVPENWDKYCEKYLVKSPWNDKITVGFQNLHILNDRVSGISSEKKLTECVDLPERRFETVYFNLSPSQRRDYNNVVSTNKIERADGEPVEIANSAIKISKLLQLCSGFVYVPAESKICDTCEHVRRCVADAIQPGASRCVNSAAERTKIHQSLRYPDNPKVSVLSELLEDILTTSKVIIWAAFEQELDDVADLLDRKKWGYVRVDGSNTKHIKKWESKFNSDPECVVYLAQISTGIAITLNAAGYTVYYSRDWSLDNRQQSLFRNFRIGQDKKTVVYDICARGSIEMQQLTALQRKTDISKLLTEQTDCTLCNRYHDCIDNGIAPWTSECVLSTGATKVIAKARTI